MTKADDAALARTLAASAGDILLAIQRSSLLEGAALGKVGDRTANAFIMAALRANRPDDSILSEEEKDDDRRLSAERVWIIDPLDGTREFGERRTDWAVHIGLSVNGVPELGAVALPGVPLTLCSHSPPPRPEDCSAELRMLVSRTRPAKEAVDVASELGASLVPMGSAGAKAMAVLRGEADIYLHTGGQYEWDNCAPAAVARAAGLYVSRVDGAPLRYNQAGAYMPDILICRPDLAKRVLAAYAQVTG